MVGARVEISRSSSPTLVPKGPRGWQLRVGQRSANSRRPGSVDGSSAHPRSMAGWPQRGVFRGRHRSLHDDSRRNGTIWIMNVLSAQCCVLTCSVPGAACWVPCCALRAFCRQHCARSTGSTQHQHGAPSTQHLASSLCVFLFARSCWVVRLCTFEAAVAACIAPGFVALRCERAGAGA